MGDDLEAALAAALAAGDLAGLKTLLARAPACVDRLGPWALRSAFGEGPVTPLIAAVRGGHEALARALLDAGADPSRSAALADPERDFAIEVAPLDMALETGSIDLVTLLLDRGAAVSDEHQRRALGADPALARAFIAGLRRRGQALSAEGWRGASHSPDPTLLDRVLAASEGPPPAGALHHAQTAANVRALVDRGADLHGRDALARSPLWAAVDARRLAVIDALMRAGADPGRAEAKGQTPLHRAADNGYDDVCAALLDHGAPVSARDDEGRTPLHLAHMPAVVAVLVERGADPNARDARGRAPLHRISNPAFAAAMTAHGADPNARDAAGETPLHAAAALLHSAVAEALLRAGADPSARTSSGETPLDLARRRCREWRRDPAAPGELPALLRRWGGH